MSCALYTRRVLMSVSGGRGAAVRLAGGVFEKEFLGTRARAAASSILLTRLPCGCVHRYRLGSPIMWYSNALAEEHEGRKAAHHVSPGRACVTFRERFCEQKARQEKPAQFFFLAVVRLPGKWPVREKDVRAVDGPTSIAMDEGQCVLSPALIGGHPPRSDGVRV